MTARGTTIENISVVGLPTSDAGSGTRESDDRATGGPDLDPNGATEACSARLRVALLTEGTYPGHGGGVSVWCDQLVSGLPEIEFEVVAITLNHREPTRWTLPQNAHLVVIPLWDRPLETTERSRRRRGRRSPAIDDFAHLLFGEPGEVGRDAAGLLDILDRLVDVATDGELAATLQHAVLCEVFTEAMMASSWFRVARHGTLLDVAHLAEIFVHLLRPLAADLGSVDVVHSSASGLPVLVGVAARRRRGTPFILSEHGLFLRERYLSIDKETDRPAVRAVLLRFHRLLAAIGYRIATAIAPVSDFNRNWELRMGAAVERVTLVHSAVDPANFTVRVVEPVEPSISWLGRIDPIKDLHTLIRAAAIVRDRVPTAVIRIFGSAVPAQKDYLASCHRLVEDLGLALNVRFEGAVAHAEDAFHAGQISALSSISEGFPYSVLESMACGVPVVGTDVGGVAEAIGDAGRTVPARDHRAFAAACLELLDSKQLRSDMGRAGRRRVVKQFGLAQMLETHDGLYRTASRRVSEVAS